MKHMFGFFILAAALTLLPQFSDTAPYVQFSKHGMSIFLSTPALVWLFYPRKVGPIHTPIWLTTAVIAALLLLYQNTGWEQFSYRFSLDILPYLVILLVVGARPLTHWFKALIIAGVLVNGFGAATFQRAGMGAIYGHHLTEEPRR